MAEHTDAINLSGSVNIGVVVTGSEKAKSDLNNIDNSVNKKRKVKIDVEVNEKSQEKAQKAIDQSFIARTKNIIKLQNELKKLQDNRNSSSDKTTQKSLDIEIQKNKQLLKLQKERRKLLTPSSSAKSKASELQKQGYSERRINSRARLQQSALKTQQDAAKTAEKEAKRNQAAIDKEYKNITKKLLKAKEKVASLEGTSAVDKSNVSNAKLKAAQKEVDRLTKRRNSYKQRQNVSQSVLNEEHGKLENTQSIDSKKEDAKNLAKARVIDRTNAKIQREQEIAQKKAQREQGAEQKRWQRASETEAVKKQRSTDQSYLAHSRNIDTLNSKLSLNKAVRDYKTDNEKKQIDIENEAIEKNIALQTQRKNAVKASAEAIIKAEEESKKFEQDNLINTEKAVKLAKQQQEDAVSKKATEANKKSQKYTDGQYRQSINEQIKLENDLYKAEQNRDKNTGSKKDQYTKEVASLQTLIDYEEKYREALTATTEAKTRANAKLQKEQEKLEIKRNNSSVADIVKALTEEQKQVGDKYKKNLLGRYSEDEITGLASATGKIEAYASAVEEAKKKYQELIEYTDSHDMSSKDNQTAADKLANNLDKTLKDLGSEKFDSFNTKGSFFKSFSGNLADVRQEVNKLLSGYEEIDQATIKWSTNQKSLTYLMHDSDGVMKKFRLNLEKTADGFNARTVELGKQTGFDKLGDMISNGFSAGANGITKVVDMYASVQDMINYAKQGIDVFTEYDAALTDISYTTEGTKEQISDMGKSYVQLAKDMSTSVEDSMKVASIYANLQTSSEEVMQSVKPTLLLANATGVDASDASDQIQGILEQFDIGTDQAEHVVDVLENVSSNLKEDFGKAINNVTEGVSAVGQTAADAGFTFEQLAAMIGKVSEKTRDSGSEIGNSLKTMLTRISKASSLTDEVDNETISKAAKSLHEVGVEVYEQDGTFRNFLTILSELKEKWNDLSDSQQADDFAWVFGNKYQRTYLIAGNALESCTTIIRKLDYEGLTTQELAVHATKLLSVA